MTVTLAFVFAVLACSLSATAGVGGSLLLVPAFTVLFGAKQAIALAAALLCANNAAKLVAYRRTVPVRAALGVLACTILGSLAGARLLLAAPEAAVQAGIAVVVVGAFLLERVRTLLSRPPLAALLAWGAGLVSGFAGTSGPLKALALRSLGLDREHFVGAASLVSFAGDLTKVIVLTPVLSARGHGSVILAGAALTPFLALLGRHLNGAMGKQAYAALFWLVMAGYALRLVVGALR